MPLAGVKLWVCPLIGHGGLGGPEGHSAIANHAKIPALLNAFLGNICEKYSIAHSADVDRFSFTLQNLQSVHDANAALIKCQEDDGAVVLIARSMSEIGSSWITVDSSIDLLFEQLTVHAIRKTPTTSSPQQHLLSKWKQSTTSTPDSNLTAPTRIPLLVKSDTFLVEVWASLPFPSGL